jgi:hypothetical protein
MEALLTFFMESTFRGLWIFGWDKLSPRLHLATIWPGGRRRPPAWVRACPPRSPG